MKVTNRSERGQALILIVFAIIGLVGMTALAVDGGRAYSERRRAQNAADSTALESAYTKVFGGDLYAEGLARAASNKFVDGDATANSTSPDVNIEIYNPPTSGPYAGDSQYVQVIITATVKTYFGRAVGIPVITNQVEAVARAKPPVISPMAFGNAIVSLSPDDCHAVTYQGNADTNVTGGGIYVNSDCDKEGNQAAFFNGSGAAHLTTPCLQAVGRIDYMPGAIIIDPPPTPPDDCINPGAAPLPAITYPDPRCAGDVAINGSNMSAGNWPPAGWHGSTKFPPAGVTHLDPGIYCLNEGDFNVSAGETLTGDSVLIRVDVGDVTINGGGNVNLTAPTEEPFDGLLLFLPESNDSTVTINGDATVSLTGTILAPSATVNINGNGSTFAMNSQVIGFIVNLAGNATTDIHYSDEDNWDAPIPASIELVQ